MREFLNPRSSTIIPFLDIVDEAWCIYWSFDLLKLMRKGTQIRHQLNPGKFVTFSLLKLKRSYPRKQNPIYASTGSPIKIEADSWNHTMKDWNSGEFVFIVYLYIHNFLFIEIHSFCLIFLPNFNIFRHLLFEIHFGF